MNVRPSRAKRSVKKNRKPETVSRRTRPQRNEIIEELNVDLREAEDQTRQFLRLTFSIDKAEELAREHLRDLGLADGEIDRGADGWIDGIPNTEIQPTLDDRDHTVSAALWLIDSAKEIRKALRKGGTDPATLISLGRSFESNWTMFHVPELRAALASHSGRKGGKRKKGHEGKLRTTIRHVMEEYKPASFNGLIDVLDRLSDADDMYDTSLEPEYYPYKVVAVERDEQIVRFQDGSGREISRTYKSIHDHFTAIRKS